MEALILLHLEDLSFFYPIIASKAGVVALLSYSNCFTTPTLIDNYRTPVGINGQSYCRLSFQLCTVNHTMVTKNKHHHCKVPFAITTVSSLSQWHDSHCLKRGCTSSRVAIDWGGASLNGNSHCPITVSVR